MPFKDINKRREWKRRYTREYREKNKEKVREINRKSYKKNIEKIRIRDRIRGKTRERKYATMIRNRIERKESPEKYREIDRLRYKKRLPQMRISGLKYYHNVRRKKPEEKEKWKIRGKTRNKYGKLKKGYVYHHWGKYNPDNIIIVEKGVHNYLHKNKLLKYRGNK